MSIEPGTSPRPIGTIAVATDFSETASHALDRAVELATLHAARLLLVHAIDFRHFTALGPEAMTESEVESRVRAASQTKLDGIAAELEASGLEVERELLVGAVAPSIAEAIEEHGADLLVAGRRGLSRFRHLLLGSTAEGLLRAAPCPTLVFHSADGARFSDIRTVLAANDFSEDSERALQALVHLFRGRTGEIRVLLTHALHVPALLEPIFGQSSLTPGSFGESPGELRSELEPAAERLREAGFAVETVVRSGDPPSVLSELAETTEADLIAIGTRGRTGLQRLALGSTAQRVLQRAACPVLVAPG